MDVEYSDAMATLIPFWYLCTTDYEAINLTANIVTISQFTPGASTSQPSALYPPNVK